MSSVPSQEGLCAWPTARLDDCLRALLRQSGWTVASTISLRASGDRAALRRTIVEAAAHCGCDVDLPPVSYHGLREELRQGGPALLGCGVDAWFAILGCRGGRVTLLLPSLETLTMPVADLCYTVMQLSAESEAETAGLRALLDRACQNRQERERAAEVLLQERLGRRFIEHYFRFTSSPSLPLASWLRACRVPRLALALASSYGIQYLLWFGSWALLGTLSFRGHVDRASLIGWTLCVATIIPFRIAATWWQGVIPIVIGGQMKRRLLDGALRLLPDEIRHQGIGAFLAQTFESEAVEQLAMGGGLNGALALIDLVVAGFVLGQMALMLAIWLGLTIWCTWSFLRRFDAWSGKRLEMTDDLVESMVGHRTRMVGGNPAEWESEEDAHLDEYARLSGNVDRAGGVLLAFIPRGWLLMGVFCLAPAIAGAQRSGASIAMELGGILLAFTAFTRLVEAAAQIAPAFVAWRRVAPLFTAAARPGELGDPRAAIEHDTPTDDVPVVACEGVSFGYARGGRAVLQNANLTIKRGEHVLLEGASGGGKSTLAALLSGLRRPHSGTILASGLDRQTVGQAEWLRSVSSVPQFHDNHVFTESLAFNLLLGRTSPHSFRDLQEAEEVSRELGLGDLIDRMPSGLLEMVGEGGWQLSHGERSRIFLARALLQRSKLLILDETFGALDPETLRMALTYTQRQTETLLLIAHP